MITFVHLLYMVLSGVLLIQRQRSAWYYFPALFFVNIAVLFRVTSYNGLIPVNLQWSLIPGSAIEALLMSFALADRFKVMRDEKEKAQAEAIVHKEQAIENLKKSDEIKNRFLANTSHELRTPLHGIIGLTRHMITHGVKNMEPEEKRTLELVLASAIRLSELINDILDYSSMVRGAVSFAKKPFNLARVAAESVSLLNELAEDKNIRIVNKLEGAELPYLNGDEKRVAQIFSNLLGNAIKYNSNCIVVVDAIPGNHYVNIKVSDDGNGMDEKQMETVFEPFQTSAGSSAKGVGLGLSIVRELVESHGGQIDVESRKNNGTTFSFTLPVFKVSDSEKYLATKAPAVEIIPERNITILAIDDEPINLEVYKHQLSKKYNTLTTLSAKDTEEILSDHTIDLILLDIMMPGIDGFELLNKIRKRFNSEDLPVIIVSARDQNHDLIEGLNRGANDYLVKPYDVEQLLRRIDNQLKMKETLENRNTELEKQRTDIYADLHDHLGSQMTDMKIIFNNIMEKKAIDPAFAFELRESMDRAVDTLRERIFHLEDIANFEEDFLGNLHAIFLRRYASAGRQLAFEYNEKVNQSLVSIARPQIRETLYTVTREIVTNDLKYGKGKSQWNYVHDNENILIIFEAGTVYELGRNKTGNGTHNIQRRLAEIGAVVKFGIEGDVFHMEICIPLVVND
jgi:two-component system sensor histidine kinase ChiS